MVRMIDSGIYLYPDTGVEGTEGVGGENITLQDDVPALNFQDTGEDKILVEGVDDIPTEAPEGPTAEELIAEKAKLESQLAQIQGVAGNTQAINGLQDILGKLASNQEALQGTIAQGKTTPSSTPVPYADFKRDLTENYYTNPVENNEKLINYMFQNQLAPVLQNIQTQLQQTAALTSKQDALTDPMNKQIMDTYAPEVEEEAKRLLSLGDMNSYKNAIQTVKLSHLGDIVAKQIEEGIQKGLEAEKLKGKQPAGSNPSGGIGVGSTVGKSKGAVKILTAKDIERANKMGLDISTKELKQQYYEILQEEKGGK